MRVLFLDPGTTETAYATWDGKTVKAGKFLNEAMMTFVEEEAIHEVDACAIEMIASYGMPVGAEVFSTCVWIGRFYEAMRRAGKEPRLVFRQAIKLHHCHQAKAKDSNIRQALIDRHGPPGTKKNPGPTYGLKEDMWAAFAGASYLHTTWTENVKTSPVL